MESDLSSIFPPSGDASNSLPFNWVVETLTKIKTKEVDTSAAIGGTMIANTNFPLSSIFPPSNFPLAWNWVFETLADIKAVDAAALEGVVIAHVPDFMSNSGGSVKERIALKCLEEWLDPQLPCPPLPPRIPESLLASGSAHQIDPNRSAVEVLLLLLNKAIKSGNQVKDGAELSKHDLHQFILKKRATLPKHSVDLLKDSITEDSRPITFSKDKVLMPRVDQIAPSTEECEKTKIWKLNIQDDSVLLQKHISASTAIDNSNRILAGRSSGSREYAADLKSSELELPNRISTNPAAENGMRILQEDPCEHGQKSPLPPQRDSGELELLKQISDSLVANSDKEIQQEDPSGSGEQSNQRNDKEFHLLKQISAAPAGNICKELLQTHRSGFEQQSPNRNDILKLLQKFSSAQANGRDKEIFRENPSGSGLQSLSLQQNGKFQLPEQIPVMQGAVNGKEILHEYPFGSEQQSDQQNASHDGGFRKLSRKTTGNTVCNSAHVSVLEPSVMPLPPSDEKREVNASGSSVDPLLWKSMVADGKLNMPKAPSVVDGCCDPSFIIDQKNKMFPDEKRRRSGISFNQDFMNGVGIESGLCLKCDKRGSLLVCSGSGCPVAVHDKCIGSLVVFDEKDRFFCPSCSYAQASLAYYKAKKKYSQAKKALASFMGKDSVKRHQERLSHPAVLRNTSPIRLVENMDCHGKRRKYQENTKTPRHHKQKESTIHHNIDNLPGRAETSQSVKRIEVSCDAGELEDREKPVDDREGVMQRQTHAAVVLDNEKMPCSSVYLDIEVTPLIELKNGTLDGHQRSEMMKYQKTLTDKGMIEGCQNVGDKQIVEAKTTLDDSDLACKETATSGIKEIYNQENLKCETVSVKTCLETQEKDVTEQNMGNLHNGKTVSPVTTAKHAKRKLNLQLNNEIVDGCRITRAAKKQLTEATARAGTANLTCEQGETSGIRESHLSQVNIKRKITPDKFSEIQNQKHQEQATDVERDNHNPPYQAVVAPLTNVGNGRKKRLHAAISQNQHPHLSSKKQIGCPSVCNDSKGQNESNYESNSSRSRHYWRPEEENALKDAMQKVSLDNGNIPWVKIWETIKHIFSEARQPGDLKDKWRNIRMKEAREREKG